MLRRNWILSSIVLTLSASCETPRVDSEHRQERRSPSPGVQTDVVYSDHTGPLRLAIVGLVHQHAEGPLWQAAQREDLEVVGVWEPDAALFARLATKHGLDASLRFDDLESMLRSTRPEAASVMTSIDDHLAVVEACAEHGVHTLVEKPLAFRVEDARRMRALAEEHGVLVLTNYETSWYGSVREAAARVGVTAPTAEGEVRKLVFRHGHRGPIEIGCYEEFTEWLTDPNENGGGALIDFGCYGAALSTWILGGVRPERVVATARTLKPDVYPHVDDDATIVLEYPNATAVIQASWAWTHDNKEMDVYTASGSLHAGKWNALLAREPDGEARAVDVAPLVEPMTDEWTYLRHVVRGECPVDALSSLELNTIVVEILDEARRQVAERR